MKRKLLTTALTAALLSGCSSIVSKSDYSVTINSNPDGAQFFISNRAGQRVHSGVTPASIPLKSSAGYFKGETYTVELQKDGYSTKTYTLTSSLDGWYFGNLLLGGLIGMLIVDPVTGAMFNLPDRVDVSLDQAVSANSKETLTIASIDSLTPEQITRLVPIN